MHSPDVAKGIWDMAPGLDNPSGVTAGSRGLARLSVPTRQFVCKPDLLLPGCSATRCPARPPACLAWLAPCGCTVQHGPTVLMLVPVSCSHGTPASLLAPPASFRHRRPHIPHLCMRSVCSCQLQQGPQQSAGDHTLPPVHGQCLLLPAAVCIVCPASCCRCTASAFTCGTSTPLSSSAPFWSPRAWSALA